ncbi:MAG: universal stress protein [Nitrospirota bacterium]
MGRFKKTMRQFEAAMTAASFAEEGELGTARQILKEEGRVLLALREGQSGSKAFRYALNTCKRIGAGLDILYVSARNAVAGALEPWLSELKAQGISYRVLQREGCLEQEIIDYAAANNGVLFAVAESSEALERECAGKRSGLSDAWSRLTCPLVVVAENTQD